MKSCLLLALLLTTTTTSAPAQQRVGKGAASLRQLVKLYHQYGDAKDTAGIRSLVFWTGVQERERDAFDRSLQDDLKFEIQKVEVGTVPRTLPLEYTIEGVTYRPALTPIGSLVITYVPRGKLRGFSTQYLVGSRGKRYFITLATPARK